MGLGGSSFLLTEAARNSCLRLRGYFHTKSLIRLQRWPKAAKCLSILKKNCTTIMTLALPRPQHTSLVFNRTRVANCVKVLVNGCNFCLTSRVQIPARVRWWGQTKVEIGANMYPMFIPSNYFYVGTAADLLNTFETRSTSLKKCRVSASLRSFLRFMLLCTPQCIQSFF